MPYSVKLGNAIAFISQTASQRKSNLKFNRNTALCSFAYTYKKSNQSAKPWQIRKYIQLLKFSKKNLLFIQFAMYLKTERFFSPSWYSATPMKSKTANFTLKPLKADGL